MNVVIPWGTSYSFSHKLLKKAREDLWNESPHCRNCGKYTFLPKTYNKPSNHHPDMATIEHRISKLQKRRGVRKKLRDITLFCGECNQAKGHLDDYYRELVRELNEKYPRVAI